MNWLTLATHNLYLIKKSIDLIENSMISVEKSIDPIECSIDLLPILLTIPLLPLLRLRRTCTAKSTADATICFAWQFLWVLLYDSGNPGEEEYNPYTVLDICALEERTQNIIKS